MCVGSVSLGKDQKGFKMRPVHLKWRSPRISLKRIPAGVNHSNYQNPQHSRKTHDFSLI